MKTYWIYPTRKCNLECKYCYQLEKPLKSMDNKTADSVIKFIRADVPGEEKRVQFFGGEPLLEYDIIRKFVNELRDEVNFSITTNGTLLNEEKCKFLREHNFGLALSLDGPPGITRKTRPGSEKTNIELIQRFFPTTQIIMTLSPENVEFGYGSTMWFVEHGFSRIAHNIATEKPWDHFAKKHHDEVFTKLSNRCIREGLHRDVSFMFIGYAIKAVSNSSRGGNRFICGSNENLLAIDTNGDLYPCQDMVTCDYEKQFKLGDVFNGYRQSTSIPVEKMKFPDRKKCGECWFLHQCVGGCGPKNLLICGDRFKPLTYGCELYSRQTMEGMRVLLNTGQLEMKRRNNAGQRR